MRTALTLGVALVAWPLSPELAAQNPPLSVEVSADSVSLAEVFELRVRIEVPPGSAVYFPDTVPTTDDIESFAPVEWRAERASDGESATLLLTYALIPFGNGDLALPTPGIIVAPVGTADRGEPLPGGSLVAAWADVPRAAGSTIRRLDVPEERVWIHPVRFGGALGEGVSPRGPDDVLGRSWSWPSVVLVGFFSTVLVAAGLATTRQWLGRRRTERVGADLGSSAADDARRAAIAAIERLIAEGSYAPDREKRAYTASSDIVRGYAAHTTDDWVPGLTSTELMTRLEGAPGGSPLAQAMSVAERVKFGRLRTGSDALHAHLLELRRWLGEVQS
ncbi:MAG: hypothetical protein ABL963_02890 [Longimicrobiales bacterium]